MSKVVYLAGAIEGVEDKGLRWRMEFEKELNKIGLECIIPNKKEKDLIGNISMSELKVSNIRRYKEIMRQIIDRDLDFVESVDMIVAKWDEKFSAGTVSEACFAYYWGKPTYLVSSLKDEDIPGWFLACFVEKFSTLDELIDYLGERC